jgi:hypothetical protein
MRSRLLAFALVSLAAASARAQDLGHKVLGTVGLDAGSQPPTGLYITERFAFYTADEVFDRTGARIPRAFDVQATADMVGVSIAYRVHPLGTYVNATIALPIARVTGSVGGVEGSLDRFGLADAFVQPLKLGWRTPRVEAQLGYAFFVPTGNFEPGGAQGVSRGAWSHDVSLGSTVWLDRGRTWRTSAIVTGEVNGGKIDIDLTRGSTLQLQGGAGAQLAHTVDVGVVGYALWQVTDDSGTALPPVLRGARDRVYGVGAELDFTIPHARSRLTLRYAHDLGARSRPQGQIFVIGLTFAPWRRER